MIMELTPTIMSDDDNIDVRIVRAMFSGSIVTMLSL